MQGRGNATWRAGGGSVTVCFFFQAEDGIRDYKVTGVQTCALPILFGSNDAHVGRPVALKVAVGVLFTATVKVPGSSAWNVAVFGLVKTGATPIVNEIGRASCRERV